MFGFFAEFLRRSSGAYRIIVMDAEALEHPRQYRVRPRAVLWSWAGAALLAGLLFVALVVFTPLRELIPGYGTAEIRREALMTQLRLAALQDSLALQQGYVRQLQRLITGRVDSTDGAAAAPPAAAQQQPTDLAGSSADWADHEQPALPVARMPVDREAPLSLASAAERYLSSIRLPAQPPVNGFLTRGFEARTGHYGLDLAVSEGTLVRAVGDGYVVLADWTYDGGYTLAIQHADGYLSVYKHNQRLLKRTGDRVRAREAVAHSGNTGETTTGPHLHFELWRNGLAQNPRDYLIEF